LFLFIALGYGYNNERSPLLRDVESDGSGMEDPRYYSPENSGNVFISYPTQNFE
jgi:hypothetical protein